MARSHLTLAALATSAVAELDLVATAQFGSNRDNDFDSALLTTREGKHLIIRVPRSESAEAQQLADLEALRALTAGVRTRLPFAVATCVGQTRAGQTHAIVYDFIYGSKVPISHIDASLATSIGRSIAALHALPTSFVSDAGLPMLGAIEALRSAVSVMDRAAATGLVPAPLVSRWQAATEDSKLWQFQPTVINDALSAGSFLSADGAVTGILGWQGLRVADPARDLAWVLADHDLADSVFDAYAAERGAADRQVRQRAVLYSELEVAKWLLHGTEQRSTEIVDDAVGMLDALVDEMHNDVMNPIGGQTMPTMAVDEVQDFLDGEDYAAVRRSQRAV